MEAEIRSLVHRVVGRVLAERGTAAHPAGVPAERRAAGVHVRIEPQRGPDRPGAPAEGEGEETVSAGRPLVSASCLASVPDGGQFPVPSGALITPLARDEARRRGIALTSGIAAPDSPQSGSRRIALGCDHGGFALKCALAGWLRELGEQVVDLGTWDEQSVDYPDFARAVAEAVAAGRCDLGICVDGAGIGSAMAANKVPGVRAANCRDVAAAKNAREHNFANVLTLGAGVHSNDTALEVLRTFLSTPTGAERHARRVEKITAIERRYARNPAAERSP